MLFPRETVPNEPKTHKMTVAGHRELITTVDVHLCGVILILVTVFQLDRSDAQ